VRDAFLSRPAYVLGRPSPVCAASIDDSDAAAAELASAGYTAVFRTAVPCWRLAAIAAAAAIDAAGDAVGPPDLSIYCTETWFEMMPAEALSRFVTSLGAGTARALALGGHGCANFTVGLDLACTEVADGRAAVLLATVDRLPQGRSRSFRDGLALLSDAAAGCLVTDRPLGDGYRVVARALRSTSTIGDDGQDLLDIRVSVDDVQAGVSEVLDRAGVGRDGVRWLVLNGHRPASNDFLAGATGLAGIARARPALGTNAHCFAADAPIVLRDLLDGGDVRDGDHVLVLGSGGRSRTAVLLRAHLARGAGPPGRPTITT
jgi:3-oxoacyl-[acyl-carrier-protein] synthase III